MPSKKTYSLYLVKKEVENFDDVLTASARDHIDNGRGIRSEAGGFGDGGVLYSFPGRRTRPKWANQVEAVFPEVATLSSQSPCAAIVFRVAERLFAVSFSFGHTYIDDRKTVADFGLRTAINYVSDEKLKSVERSNIGVAIRDFAQAASHKDLQAFGLDDVLDLIRKVSGISNPERPEEGEFADRVTGARSLRFTKDLELTEVPGVAHQSLELYSSLQYQSTRFKVIDFLSPVLDTVLISMLDEELLNRLKDGGDQFEISLPSIVDDRTGSYKFQSASIGGYFPDVSIEIYRNGLGDRLGNLDVPDLKRHRIAVYNDTDTFAFDHWSIHRSLVGSVEFNGTRYAINEGLWYSIGDQIKEAADQSFERLRADQPDPNFPRLIQKITGTGRNPKRSWEAESDYNERVASSSDYLLLDRKLISVEGQAGPGIEICDLLELALDEDGWTVEFQIADLPRANGEHNIPFFSKLTLKDEARRLAAMGFTVRIGFVTLRVQ